MGTAFTGTVVDDRLTLEGGRNVTYDLTGVDPEFSNDPDKNPEGKPLQITYYKNGGEQQFELPYTSYVRDNSGGTTARLRVVAYIENDIDPNNPTIEARELVYTPDPPYGATNWWHEVEEDQSAMGKALSMWSEKQTAFTGTFAKKIVFCVGTNNQCEVKIFTQQFYKEMVDMNGFHGGRGPVYTRELGQYLLEQIDSLQARTATIARNMFGDTATSDEILDEDLTAKNPANRVNHELHYNINTSLGRNILTPAKGAFYPGRVEDGTRFVMNKYYTETGMIDESDVKFGTRDGWLFIYTENNAHVYNETINPVFAVGVAYFVIEPTTGGYRRIEGGQYILDTDVPEGQWYEKPNPNEEVYVLTTDVKFQPNKRYYYVDASGQYMLGIAGDYIFGSPVAEFGMKVFERRTILASETGFNASDDLSAGVITREIKVLLTRENVGRYLNYVGTFVKVFANDDERTNPIPFVYGEDYDFADCDLTKTERGFTEQSVFNQVRFLKEANEEVPERVIGISYQAFGGLVTPKDVRSMRKDVSNAMTILTGSKLVTADNLSKQTVVKDLLSRLRRMENFHDHHMIVDHDIPTTLEGFHWFNIAMVYDVNWMADVGAVKEIGTFRISSKRQGWCYEFTASVDLSKEGSDAFQVNVLGSHNNTVNDVTDVMGVIKGDSVGLRLCWNKVRNGTAAGAILQLGIDCAKYEAATSEADDHDTITVANKSGNESKWTLYYDPLETTQFTDAPNLLYGHIQRRECLVGEEVDPDELYYRSVPEYSYYATGDGYTKSGKTYYKKDSASGTFIEAEVDINVKVDTLGYTLYERAVYRNYWQVVTVSGTIPEKGYYVVNPVKSHDDDTFILPDGKTEWRDDDDDSLEVTRMLGTTIGGVIVWAGLVPLSIYSFGPCKAHEPFVLSMSLDLSSQNYIGLDSIKSVTIGIYDRKNDTTYLRTFNAWTAEEFVAGSDGKVQVCKASGLFFEEDLCGMVLTLYKDATGMYAVVEAGLGANSYLNDRFDLRQIRVYF